jgi:PAP2 superfamily.
MTRALPLFLALLAASPRLAAGQTIDSIPELPATRPASSDHVIRWYHGAAALGGVSALMLLDHPVQRYAMHNNGTGANNVAKVVRHFGQPEVYASVTAGLVATGLITGHPGITRSGGRLALSLALAGFATEAGKTTLGRPRPEESLDADGSPRSPGRRRSLGTQRAGVRPGDLARGRYPPALGHRRPVRMATAVGWSRINDNRHWLSDVAAGAIVGITSAKLASGRWHIFGLRPPSFITGPSGMGLGWHGQF